MNDWRSEDSNDIPLGPIVIPDYDCYGRIPASYALCMPMQNVIFIAWIPGLSTTPGTTLIRSFFNAELYGGSVDSIQSSRHEAFTPGKGI